MGCIFILLNEGVVGNLVAAVQLGKQIAQLFWFLENELNCHDKMVMISDTKFINRFLIGTSIEQRFKLIKGLFTWRWGTPGRCGNPLRWGNPPVHTISHFNVITFTF